MHEWLIYDMDGAPFHRLIPQALYESSVTTKQISEYPHEHDNDLALQIDTHHDMNPLHVLSMNPHAPADTF